MLELVRRGNILTADRAPAFRLAPGTRLEMLDETWAAYSALSGDTMQLNAEAAAVVELLAEGPHSAESVCALLAEDSATSAAQVAAALHDVWQQLVAAGLVRTA